MIKDLDKKVFEIKENLQKMIRELEEKEFSKDNSSTCIDSFSKYIRKLERLCSVVSYDKSVYSVGPVSISSDGFDLQNLISIAEMVNIGKITDQLQLLITLRNSPAMDCSTFGADLKTLYLKQSFSPLNMTRIDDKVFPDHGTDHFYDTVTVGASVPSVLSVCQARYGDYSRYHYLLSYLYDKTNGLRSRHSAGTSEEAYLRSLKKMERNIVSPRAPMLNASILMMDLYLRRFGVHHKNNRIALFPDVSKWRKWLLEKDSSGGSILDHFVEVSKSSIQIHGKFKKRDIPEYTIQLALDWINDTRLYTEGKIDKVRDIPLTSVENKKRELLTYDLWNQLYRGTKYEKAMYKQRLFYMCSAFWYIIERWIFEPFSTLFRYFESGIGLKPEGGGFLIAFDCLAGTGVSPLKETWAEVTARIFLEHGVDLSDRMYGQGDWSGYDNTLLACLLAVISASIASIYVPSEEITAPMLEYILTEFVKQCSYNVLYIYAFKAHFKVWGTMFSGKFGTSNNDTMYQILLKSLYLSHVMDKYPDDPILQAIMDSHMVVFLFYGDDHTGGWPVYMHNCLLFDESDNLLEDFVRFSISFFGMQYKISEYAVFDKPFGTVCYETTPNGDYVEVYREDGPSFLRNQVNHIFLDGVYATKLPWRESEDLVYKAGMTLNATSGPMTFALQSAGIARLCPGNLEMYSYYRNIYDTTVEMYGEPTADDIKAFSEIKHSFSLRMAIGSQPVSEFPSWAMLVAHQYEGYNNGTGLAPKFEEAYMDGTSLYANTGVPLEPLHCARILNLH